MKVWQSIWWRKVWALVLGCALASFVAVHETTAQSQPQVPVLPGKDPDLRLQLKNETTRKKLLLSSLFKRLKQSQNADNARVLEGAIWKMWLKSGSPTIDLLMEQVIRSMARGEFPRTLKLLDHMVKLAPEYSEAWNKRATVLYYVGKYQASLDDIERVLELEPRHFGALSGMGLVLQQLDDKKGALNAFRRALRVHPHLPSAQQAVKALEKEVEGQGI